VIFSFFIAKTLTKIEAIVPSLSSSLARRHLAICLSILSGGLSGGPRFFSPFFLRLRSSALFTASEFVLQ